MQPGAQPDIKYYPNDHKASLRIFLFGYSLQSVFSLLLVR
jgi:hypothetical protein